MSVTVRYDHAFLNKFVEEYGLTLIKDYSNEQMNRDTKIEGKCINPDCGNNFCKLFIKSQNRLIEVKSVWTIQNRTKNLLLKRDAAREMGFVYDLWVYTAKGEKVDIAQYENQTEDTVAIV